MGYEYATILDNHKIPRKYRKDYYFTVYVHKDGYVDSTRPYCSGAEWISKNKYIDVHVRKYGFPLKKTNGKGCYTIHIKDNLVTLKTDKVKRNIINES